MKPELQNTFIEVEYKHVLIKGKKYNNDVQILDFSIIVLEYKIKSWAIIKAKLNFYNIIQHCTYVRC